MAFSLMEIYSVEHTIVCPHLFHKALYNTQPDTDLILASSTESDSQIKCLCLIHIYCLKRGAFLCA